jgi:deoxyribonuclease-4
VVGLSYPLKLGVHVSISGGVSNSPDKAYERGCTAFQIFTRNPRGWRYQELSVDEAEEFWEKVRRYGYDSSVASHMPYLPNLASPDERIYRLSLDTLIAEVERAGLLHIPYLVIHLGSHMGRGIEIGRRNLVNAIESALSKVDNEVMILLENMAGQRNSMGSKFEDIAILIDSISFKDRIGVCFDTSHAFSAGYDLRDKYSVEETLREFDSIIGFKWLRIVHINDSRADLGQGRDIHEHIGLGFIGEDGFKYILRHPIIRSLPLILETPVDERREDVGNIMKVWELSGIEPPSELVVRWRRFLALEKRSYAKKKTKKSGM